MLAFFFPSSYPVPSWLVIKKFTVFHASMSGDCMLFWNPRNLSPNHVGSSSGVSSCAWSHFARVCEWVWCDWCVLDLCRPDPWNLIVVSACSYMWIVELLRRLVSIEVVDRWSCLFWRMDCHSNSWIGLFNFSLSHNRWWIEWIIQGFWEDRTAVTLRLLIFSIYTNAYIRTCTWICVY